jgi:hypothetical protein
MTVYLRRFKKVEKTDECDGGVAAPVGDVACAQPFDSAPSGMGNAVPIGSADRWDNVLGIGGKVINQMSYPMMDNKPKKRYKIKRRKK